MITISRIIPDVWSALQSHGPQNSNQSKKVPVEGLTLVSQVACIVILHYFIFPRSANPGIAGGVSHSTDTLLSYLSIIILSKVTLARDSEDLCWEASNLTIESAVSPRVERFLIMISFVFTPKPGVSEFYHIQEKTLLA